MSDMVNGLYPKEKHHKAPDFVIGKLAINVSQFRDWMQQHLAENPGAEWINIDLKTSRAGKGYAALDTWKPKESAQDMVAKQESGFRDDDPDSIPF